MVVSHLPEARVLSNGKIDVAITGYQLPQKSGLLLPAPPRPSVPSQEAPSISVLSSPYNSSLSVAHLSSRPVWSQSVTSPVKPVAAPTKPAAEDVKPFEGESLPPSSLLFLRVEVPLVTSMAPSMTPSVTPSMTPSMAVAPSMIHFECAYELRRPGQTQEVVAAVLQWLRSLRLLRSGDVAMVQQRVVEAIEGVVSKVVVEEAKVVKKAKTSVEEAKGTRKSKEGGCRGDD